jgi:tripartite-type tricarboxylate transporter receptor subunit TctC
VPKEIVARLNAEVGKILASSEVNSRFINEGVEPIGGTPEFFTSFIRDEIAKYAKVVKAANLKGE